MFSFGVFKLRSENFFCRFFIGVAFLFFTASIQAIASQSLSREEISDLESTLDQLALLEQEERTQEALEVVNPKIEKYSTLSSSQDINQFERNLLSQFFHAGGITLYRAGKYKESLKAFSLNKNSSFKVDERNYFMGLSFLNLNRKQQSYSFFKSVLNNRDSDLFVPSAFFISLIDFEEGRLDIAKKRLKQVAKIGTGTIKAKAEDLLRAIDSPPKKISFFFQSSVLSDSNLLAANPEFYESKVNGFRTLIFLLADYAFYSTQRLSLDSAFSVSEISAFNDSFEKTKDLRTTDSNILSASVGGQYNLITGKDQLASRLSFDSLAVNYDGEGEKDPYTTNLGWSNIWTHSWVGGFHSLQLLLESINLQASLDNLGADVSGNRQRINSKTGIPISFRGQEILSLISIQYQINNTNSDDLKNNKKGLGLSFLTDLPLASGNQATLSMSLDWAEFDYFRSSGGRKDQAIASSVSLEYPFNKKVGLASEVLYRSSSSNESLGQYNQTQFSIGLNVKVD